MASHSQTDPRAEALDRWFSRCPESLADACPAVVFRAVPGAYLDRLRQRPLCCVQTDKTVADALARLGVAAVAEPEAPAGLCVVFGTKHREEALHHCARAASLLEEGGWFVAVAANDLGAASLERRCAELMGGIESYSKHKCRVFTARKDSARLNRDLLEDWLRAGEWRAIPGADLVSRPGMFSWKAVDPGSRLLARHLPGDLAGRGADLGAGYGYLSRELLARCPGVAELHLFEAERKALDAAERNLAGRAGGAALRFHWADVTAGLGLSRLDFVAMNPPFHAGREAVSALGRAFVREGLAALRPGGRLFLVANRHLPYEREIEARGAGCAKLAEEGGFKVLRAAR
jgi:16S rRNA (guanine1207-N2)-methyltransferase